MKERKETKTVFENIKREEKRKRSLPNFQIFGKVK